MFKLFTKSMDDFRVNTWTMTFFFNFFFHFPELIAKAGFWPESALEIGRMTKNIITTVGLNRSGTVKKNDRKIR